VEVDSTERPDIPPFGGSIDYLTFGGIYRDVELRVVPQTHLAGVFAKPVRVLSNDRAVVVRCYLDGPVDKPLVITAELRDGDRVVKTASATVNAAAEYHDVTIETSATSNCGTSQRPKLYQVTRGSTTAMPTARASDSGKRVSPRRVFISTAST
jgi:beta-galactosidase